MNLRNLIDDAGETLAKIDRVVTELAREGYIEVEARLENVPVSPFKDLLEGTVVRFKIELPKR